MGWVAAARRAVGQDHVRIGEGGRGRRVHGVLGVGRGHERHCRERAREDVWYGWKRVLRKGNCQTMGWGLEPRELEGGRVRCGGVLRGVECGSRRCSEAFFLLVSCLGAVSGGAGTHRGKLLLFVRQ